MSKYKCVEVEAAADEIAKRMIDGEIFYNSTGSISYQWFCGKFISSQCRNGVTVTGVYYERKEFTWEDRLKEGESFLCWVNDRDPEPKTEICLIRGKSKAGRYNSLDQSWAYATPLTDSELEAFKRGL